MTTTQTESKILEALVKARQHVKYPGFKLSVQGRPLVFKLAGPRSKYAGSVNITDGGHYGSNVWYGRINPDGSVFRAWAWNRDVDQIVHAMEVDLVAVVAAYGKLTGRCAFCHLPLSDERSLEVGYGPICADHYGLPWG